MNFDQNNYLRAALEDALKHFLEPAWLGEYSPLATAYFLGMRLQSDKTSVLERGRILQTLLTQACSAIDGKYRDRYQRLIEEYYFHDRPATVVGDLLGLSKNGFHVSRNGAIDALDVALTQLVQPALRLEQPPIVATLFERQPLLDQCLT